MTQDKQKAEKKQFSMGEESLPIKKWRGHGPSHSEQIHDHSGPSPNEHPLLRAQRAYGNQAFQRLMREREPSKLGTRPLDGKYEREAEHVAEEVSRRSVSEHVPTAREDGQRHLASKISPVAQRDTQRGDVDTVPPIVDEVLKSSGERLHATTRSSMEAHFGHDFGGVRVHRGARAAESVRAVDARAYTVGQDIVLGEAYRPETGPGRSLLAHELAHVVQQRNTERSGPIQRKRRKGREKPTKAQLQEAEIKELRQELEELRQRQTRLGEQQTQMNYRSRTLIAVDEFRSIVDERSANWEKAALSIGSAYVLAVDRYNSALEKQAKSDAFRDAVVLGVLTAATAGTLSWVSTAVQAGRGLSEVVEAQLNAAEDVVQALVGEGIDVAQANAPKSPSPIKKPLMLQNGLVINVLDARTVAARMFADLYRELSIKPLSEFSMYTELTVRLQIIKWMYETSSLPREDQLPPREAMAKELERGIWATWAHNLLRVRRVSGFSGINEYVPGDEDRIREYHSYNKIGGDIEDRFWDLGITQASGVGKFGSETTQSEIKKVHEYLTNYKVRNLMDATEEPPS